MKISKNEICLRSTISASRGSCSRAAFEVVLDSTPPTAGQPGLLVGQGAQHLLLEGSTLYYGPQSSGGFTLSLAPVDSQSGVAAVGISGAGMSAGYTYNGDGERVKAEITTGSGTTTTAYIGDYFEISVGDPIPPQTPTPPDCSVSSCVFLPLLLSASQAIPDGQVAGQICQFNCC